MINKKIFSILYKIFKEENLSIDFLNNIKNNNSKFIAYLISKNIKEKFINYVKNKENLKKDLLYVPENVKITNSYGCMIIYKDIYDGFIYLNKKTYLLYDFSLKKELMNIKKIYQERIKNYE